MPEVGGLQSEASSGQKLQKLTKAKRAGNVAQVAESLPTKLKTLSSVSPPPPKKNVLKDETVIVGEQFSRSAHLRSTAIAWLQIIFLRMSAQQIT
jgi:hypothetical protein